MTAHAKLFMHGRSQAVRLPKEFRMPGTQVRVTREGDKVILQPVDSPPEVKDWSAFWARLHAMGSEDFMAEGRQQPPMPPDRDYGFDP